MQIYNPEYLEPHQEEAIEDLITTFGINSNDNPNGKIISCFRVGSYGTTGVNEGSDIDVILVMQDSELFKKKNYEAINGVLKDTYKIKIKFWVQSESMFLDPARYIRSEPAYYWDLDGWDSITPMMSFYNAVASRVNLRGKPLEELLPELLPKAKLLDGYGFAKLSTRYFAKGLFGRNKSTALRDLIYRGVINNYIDTSEWDNEFLCEIMDYEQSEEKGELKLLEEGIKEVFEGIRSDSFSREVIVYSEAFDRYLRKRKDKQKDPLETKGNFKTFRYYMRKNLEREGIDLGDYKKYVELMPQKREEYDDFEFGKKQLSEDYQKLNWREEQVKMYIVEKDNDVAKASLRLMHATHVMLGGQPLGMGEKERYKEIHDLGLEIIQRAEFDDLRSEFLERTDSELSDLLDEIHGIKCNYRKEDGKIYDRVLHWDWSDGAINSKTTNKYALYFSGITEVLDSIAFRNNLQFDKDFVDRMNYHLARRAPQLIKLISSDQNINWNILSLYVDETVDFLKGGYLKSRILKEELPDEERELVRNKSVEFLEKILKERYEQLPEENGREWLRRGRIYSALADQYKTGDIDFKSRHKIALRSFDRFLKLQKDIMKNPSEAVKLRTLLDSAQGLKETGHSFIQLGGSKAAKRYLEKSLLFNSRDAETWRLYGKPDIANHIIEPRLHNFEELLPEDSKLLFGFQHRYIDRILRFNEEVIIQEMEGLNRTRFSGEPDLQKIRRYISQRLDQKDRLDFIDLMRGELAKLPGKRAYEAENIFWQKMEMMGLGPYQTLSSGFGDEFSKRLDDRMIEISSKNRAEGLKSFRRDFRNLYLIGKDELYVKAMIQDGEPEDAVTYCDILLSREENKKNASLWFHKGRAFEELGKYRSSSSAYEKARELNPKDFDFGHRLELVKKRLAEEFDLRSMSRYIPPILEKPLAEIKEIPEFTEFLGVLDAFYFNLEKNTNQSAQKVSAKTALAQLTQSIYNTGGWPAIFLAKRAIPIYKNIFDLMPGGTNLEGMLLEPEISEFFNKEIGLEVENAEI